MTHQNWTAHYIYQDEDGNTRSMTTQLTADDHDQAMKIAAKSPPGNEFVVSVYPLSDDQILDGVRMDALKKTGKQCNDIEGFVAAWEAENPDDSEQQTETDKQGLEIQTVLQQLLQQHKKAIAGKK